MQKSRLSFVFKFIVSYCFCISIQHLLCNLFEHSYIKGVHPKRSNSLYPGKVFLHVTVTWSAQDMTSYLMVSVGFDKLFDGLHEI